MTEQDHTGRRNPLTRMMVDCFDDLMRQCMFCLPGRITSFDPETQLAQVECGIQRLRNGQGTTIPVIESVPVCFPGDGEFYFWHQITTGETEGLIHFSQRAIDTWIDQGGPVAPHEARMLTEDDAFFVPGVRSRPGAIPDFKNDGAGISNYAQDTYAHLKSSGVVEVVSAGDTTVTAGGNATVDAPQGNITTTSKGDTTINCENAAVNANAEATVTAPTSVTVDTPAATFTGTVTCAGLSFSAPLPSGSYIDTNTGTLELQNVGVNVTGADVVADGISLKTHTHPGDSGGTTGPPQ